MKNLIAACAAAAALAFQVSAVAEEQTVLEGVLEACKPEIETYCKHVTPGKGRLVACFLAHEDKLSPQCDYALYQAASALEQLVNAFKYVATACDADIDSFCSDVKPGEGRILSCLKKNSEEISVECNKALADVGAN